MPAAVSGFAGSTADCLALRERLEAKLEVRRRRWTAVECSAYCTLPLFTLPLLFRRIRGNSPVPALNSPKTGGLRSECCSEKTTLPIGCAQRKRESPTVPRYLRQLEAIMLVVDKDVSLTVTGAWLSPPLLFSPCKFAPAPHSFRRIPGDCRQRRRHRAV